MDKGIYSKNIVKLHSHTSLLSDKFIVAILNSKFINYYIKSFITSTHTLQINDGRLIPIKIPDEKTLYIIEELVNQIISNTKENNKSAILNLENEIDQMVYKLYGLTDDEIAIVEEATQPK